ncbi:MULTISPECIES: hypothetical protein [unclassified Thiobacillus]|uniref:hypothetical protein n=1 Tax=unclassified Thiobacillus TaxID=2646513 RepID=UPI001AC94821|nr:MULTISPECIES: hypothetical protein [unclassified Thiobacillus]MBN8779727.1 hypothetical protein [Thiobacillus sp.]
MPFDRGNRTYYASDDRLRAFRALSPADKLRWVEQLAAFLRLVQPVESAAASDQLGTNEQQGKKFAAAPPICPWWRHIDWRCREHRHGSNFKIRTNGGSSAWPLCFLITLE